MVRGTDVAGQLAVFSDVVHTHVGEVVVDGHVGGDVEDLRFLRVAADLHLFGDGRVVADDVPAFVQQHLGAGVVSPLADLGEVDVETQAPIDAERSVIGPHRAQGEQNRRIVRCNVTGQRPPCLQSECLF